MSSSASSRTVTNRSSISDGTLDRCTCILILPASIFEQQIQYVVHQLEQVPRGFLPPLISACLLVVERTIDPLEQQRAAVHTALIGVRLSWVI